MVKIFQFRANENPSFSIICVKAKFEKSDVLKSGIFEDPHFRICVYGPACEQAKDINVQLCQSLGKTKF